MTNRKIEDLLKDIEEKKKKPKVRFDSGVEEHYDPDGSQAISQN